MNEKSERIIKAVAEALPNMSEFDKGYMLGMVESNSDDREKKSEEQKGE